jgi:protein gp37
MGRETNISWTDATWNPIRGCSRVSEGCRNCYAEKIAHRFSGEGLAYEGLVQLDAAGKSTGKWNGKIEFIEDRLLDPMKWQNPRRIFVNSMSDLFHENVNRTDLRLILAVILLCPQHTFQVLTKRPENMKAILTEPGFRSAVMATAAQLAFDLQSLKVYARIRKPSNTTEIVYDCGKYGYEAGCRVSAKWPMPNLHLGVSVEDQKTADERIPLLLQTPAAVRFLSIEPLLESVGIRHFIQLDEVNGLDRFREKRGWGYDRWSGGFTGPNTHHDSCYAPELGIDWVIVGGESGAGARPMHPDWARSLRDQCKAAGVAFFFKQNGDYVSVSEVSGAGRHHQFPDGATVRRVGTKAAGCLLDGVEHHEFPVVGEKKDVAA